MSLRLSAAFAVATLAFGSALAEAPRKPVIGINMDVRVRDDGGVSFSPSTSCIEAVEAAGGLPVMLPALKSPEEAARYADVVDGFVFVGGPDIDPARYGEEPHETAKLLPPRRELFDFALMDAALDSGKPMLCICLGMQELNVALGGTLIQDIPSEAKEPLMHRQDGEGPKAMHDVNLAEGAKLRRILEAETMTVNSYHHQACDTLGASAVVVAKSPDGIVEAIEVKDHPFAIGVQWHPEFMEDDAAQQRIFSTLVEAARNPKPAKSAEAAAQ